MAKPIRSQNGEKELNTQVLTVHASVHKSNQSKQVSKIQESQTMAEQRNLANSKISNVYVHANYESDKTIQKVIRLVKDRKSSVISRLPPPRREKFNSFSVDEKGLLFMDQRLVIPKDMRESLRRPGCNVKRSRRGVVAPHPPGDSRKGPKMYRVPQSRKELKMQKIPKRIWKNT